MSCKTFVSRRPKVHAIYDKLAARWVLVEPAVMGMREQEFMRRLAIGRTTKQIADDMGVSLKTVNSYSRDLQAKFKVNGLRALFLAAIDLYRPQRSQKSRERGRSSNRGAVTDPAPGTAPSRAL